MAIDGPIESRSGEPDVRSKLRDAFRKTKAQARPARPPISTPVPVKEAAPPPAPLPAEPRHAILDAVSAARPPDVNDRQWRVAMKGLEAFLAAGHGDEAERLGWGKDELYRVPPVWARVELCGAGLLIGDSEVVAITPTRIGIKTRGGAEQGFYRKAAINYGLAYHARLKMAGEDSTREEVQLRSFEAVINLYRSHHPNADVGMPPKRAVLATIAAKGEASP